MYDLEAAGDDRVGEGTQDTQVAALCGERFGVRPWNESGK